MRGQKVRGNGSSKKLEEIEEIEEIEEMDRGNHTKYLSDFLYFL